MRLVIETGNYTKQFENPVFDTSIWKCEKCNLTTLQEKNSLSFVPHLTNN